MPKVLSSVVSDIEYRPRLVKGATLFVQESILELMLDHADLGFMERKEIMGLMMGSMYRDDLGRYAVVRGAVTTKLDSNETSVKFDKDSLEELFDNMDDSSGEVVVGWYHSHPGFGCYLSDTDLRTHIGIFGNELGFAMVIDPSDGMIKVFTCVGGVQTDVFMVIIE